MNERSEEQIVEESAACPTCGACPGEPCEDSSGEPISNPHLKRYGAAGFEEPGE